RFSRDWSSDVCSSDLGTQFGLAVTPFRVPNSRTPWLAVSAPLGGQGSCGTVHFFDSQGGLRSWLQGPGALSRFGTWLVAGDDLRSEERRVGKEGRSRG